MTHLTILKKLENAGHQALLVGGAVRDGLLGLPVKDLDLATSASPAEVLALFPGNSHQLHSRSGAPVVSVAGLEVASFRKDEGQDRHSVSFSPATLNQDAQRRDLTVNALYQDRHGRVIDPTGHGLADLQAGRVRFVGNAAQRIQEDPVRILRAFRIAAQKGFQVAPGDLAAIQENAGELARVASEQVGRELLKILQVPTVSRVEGTFRSMLAAGVLAQVLPEVANLAGVQQNDHHQEGDAFEHTMLVLRNSSPSPVVRMAALLHDTGKAETQEPRKNGNGFSFHGHEKVSLEHTERVLARLAVFNRRDREAIGFAVLNHMRFHKFSSMARKKQVVLTRNPAFPVLLALGKADALGKLPQHPEALSETLQTVARVQAEDRLLSDLGLSAKTLLAAGEKPGPVLGQKLRTMQTLLDKDPTKTANELLSAVGHRQQ